LIVVLRLGAMNVDVEDDMWKRDYSESAIVILDILCLFSFGSVSIKKSFLGILVYN